MVVVVGGRPHGLVDGWVELFCDDVWGEARVRREYFVGADHWEVVIERNGDACVDVGELVW